MNIKQIEKEIQNILINGGIEQNEAKIESKMLIKHYFKFSDVDLLVKDDQELDVNDCELVIEKAQFRAETRTPIQHILGHAYFMGEDFIVNEHVLIPRDETEILVRKAVELIKDASTHNSPLTSHFNILDIGTGSGCIACMIAKLADAQVLGVDISTEALQIALDNSSKLGLYNKAIFRKSDIFLNIKKGEMFDVVVSNPPYIPEEERKNLQVEVQFEPEKALFAKDLEGVAFYDKIIKQAPDFLKDDGYLIFELGIGQAELVKSFMSQNGFKDIGIEKDLAGIDRVIWGRK